MRSLKSNIYLDILNFFPHVTWIYDVIDMYILIKGLKPFNPIFVRNITFSKHIFLPILLYDFNIETL